MGRMWMLASYAGLHHHILSDVMASLSIEILIFFPGKDTPKSNYKPAS